MTMSSIRPTRHPALGYDMVEPGLWRFFTTEDGRPVGPQYRSKAELLADLDRYAQDAGWNGPVAPADPLAAFDNLALVGELERRGAFMFVRRDVDIIAEDHDLNLEQARDVLTRAMHAVAYSSAPEAIDDIIASAAADVGGGDDDSDEGCPHGDPDCDVPADGCHDACSTFAERDAAAVRESELHALYEAQIARDGR